MSIVTLKAKTKQKQNVSHNGIFSLNGGIRNTSYIGKTKHNNIYTPFTRYGGPQTYGNTKNNDKIIYNKVYTSNDSNVIKKSAINTSGLIEENNKWKYKGSEYTGKNDKLHSSSYIGPGSIDSSEYTSKLSETSKECSTVSSKCGLESNDAKLQVVGEKMQILAPYNTKINFDTNVIEALKTDYLNHWISLYDNKIKINKILEMDELINVWRYKEDDDYIYCRIYYKYSGLNKGYDNALCNFDKQSNKFLYTGAGIRATETGDNLPTNDGENYELIFPVNN